MNYNSNLAKTLSKYATIDNINNNVTIIMNNNDLNTLQKFLIENPEILINLIKNKKYNIKQLSNILTMNNNQKIKYILNDKEDTFKSKTNIEDNIKNILDNFLNTKTKNIKNGFKIVNLCNKLDIVKSNNQLKHLAKKIEKNCINDENVYGIVYSKNKHIALINSHGQIEKTDHNDETEEEEKIYLKKIPSNKNLNISYENIKGQIIDNNNKVIALVVEINNKKFIQSINNINMLNGIPIHNI